MFTRYASEMFLLFKDQISYLMTPCITEIILVNHYLLFSIVNIETFLMVFETEKLSVTDDWVELPHFSPDQTKLVYLRNEPVGPHRHCSQLVMVSNKFFGFTSCFPSVVLFSICSSSIQSLLLLIYLP